MHSPPLSPEPEHGDRENMTSSASAFNPAHFASRAAGHAGPVVLPPNLSHLHYAHHSFPLFMLLIAQKLFRAKCRDLGISPSNEKERRFVWLLCRQSMGGGAGGARAQEQGADDDLTDEESNPGGLLSFRVPDANLGALALKELCAFLAPDRRFGHLQLSGNVISDAGAEGLAQLMRDNDVLTSLDIRGCGLGQSAFALLLESITDHPALTALDASSLKSEGRMFLGIKGCKALARLLKKNTVLRKLHLSNAGLVSEGIPGVTRGLCLNRTLTSLDLSANDLGQKSIARIGESILALQSLESLYLSDNPMGTVGVVLLCDALRRLENLSKLDLRRVGMGLRGFTILTDAVGDMISLQELLVDGNSLADNARAGSLGGLGGSASIMAQESLRNADLKHNDFIDSVAKRLHLGEKRVSPRLLLNTALRTLSLSQTTLSDRVLEDVAKVLASHKALQNLNLAQNNLGDAGGFALAELVRCSPSLRNIHAQENSVGDEGGAALCLALANPKSQVTFLSLRVNNLGKTAATAILHALSVQKQLHVDLSGNKIPWVLYSKIMEYSTRNRSAFQSSLAVRYQDEWEKLQARHAYRLEIEESCADAVEELAALQSKLAALEASRAPLQATESAATAALQEEFQSWNHQLHECHAVESKAEMDLAAQVKDLDGRVAALRKGIEKEQRFIVQAEKQIPQLIEEKAAVEAEIEAGLVDVRRDLRLYTNDRNVEFDSVLMLKTELQRFLRELEHKMGGGRGSGKKKGGARSRSNSRPGSSKGRKSEGNSARGKAGQRSPSPRSRKGTRPPSASGSGSNTRPSSGKPKAAAATSIPVGAPSSRPKSEADRAARAGAGRSGRTSAAAAAAPASPAKASKPSTGKKKKSAAAMREPAVSANAADVAGSPESLAAALMSTPRDVGGDSSLVSLQAANNAASAAANS